MDGKLNISITIHIIWHLFTVRCWTHKGSCHLSSYSWQVTAGLQLHSLLVHHRCYCFECFEQSPVFPHWSLGDAFSCGSTGLSFPPSGGFPRSSAGKWHAVSRPLLFSSKSKMLPDCGLERSRDWQDLALVLSQIHLWSCGKVDSFENTMFLLDSLQWTTWIVWMKAENRWRSTTCMIGWTRPRWQAAPGCITSTEDAKNNQCTPSF